MRPLAALLLLLPLAGCADDGAGDGAGDRKLTVLAAASLTEVFTELAGEFEASHEGVEVVLSFGSSTTLADQVAQGAPGDVLATADEKSMTLAEDADALDGDPVSFASNELVLVVPAANPARIASLDDLPGTDWVRCADDVPCGRVATTLAEANALTAEPASLEVDVKSVLAKVTSGEADAGLVYATDAESAGDQVEVIEIPHAEEHLTYYFIAVVDQADEGALAAEWVDLLQSEAGLAVLDDAGFASFVAG